MEKPRSILHATQVKEVHNSTEDQKWHSAAATTAGMSAKARLGRRNCCETNTIPRQSSKRLLGKVTTLPKDVSQKDAGKLKLPIRSEDIQREAENLVERSGFPVNVVSKHTPNLKDALVKSVLNPTECSVKLKRVRRREQRRRGGNTESSWGGPGLHTLLV